MQGGKCQACSRTVGGTGWKYTETRSQRGYDNAWLKLRARKIARNPVCELCEQRGHTTVATEVHHVIPFNGLRDTLRLDINNLQALCGACHNGITTRRARVSP